MGENIPPALGAHGMVCHHASLQPDPPLDGPDRVQSRAPHSENHRTLWCQSASAAGEPSNLTDQPEAHELRAPPNPPAPGTPGFTQRDSERAEEALGGHPLGEAGSRRSLHVPCASSWGSAVSEQQGTELLWAQITTLSGGH